MAVAIRSGIDLEITAPQSLQVGAGRDHPLRNLEPDLAPFVDEPGADKLVGLVDPAVQQLETQPIGSSLLQETLWLRLAISRCRPEPGPPVAAPPWSPLAESREKQCRRRYAHWRSSIARAPVPAVDRPTQRAPHPGVVKRFFLWFGCTKLPAIPVALLHRDFVTERLDDLVAGRGWQSAELYSRPIAANSLDPHRLFIGENAGKTVEIRKAFAIIIGFLTPLIACPVSYPADLNGRSRERSFRTSVGPDPASPFCR